MMQYGPNDCHKEVLTSSPEGAIERPLKDNTSDPLFIVFMIPDDMCNKTASLSEINIDFTCLGPYLYSESMS